MTTMDAYRLLTAIAEAACVSLALTPEDEAMLRGTPVIVGTPHDGAWHIADTYADDSGRVTIGTGEHIGALDPEASEALYERS